MPTAGEPIREDEILVRYLLGSLPEEQAARLDELSITDDEFVWRIRAAENDLIDAYLRNELSGETLDRFRSSYLSSPLRREKVKFAEALLTLSAPEAPSSPRMLPRRPLIPRWAVAASIAAAFVVGFLAYDDMRLRTVVEDSRRAPPKQASSQEPPTPAGESTQAGIVAMVLRPPVRGATALPELALPRGADRARFDLELEADDFGSYRVELKNSSGQRTLWRSETIQAHAAHARRVVSIVLPAGLLEPGAYILAVSAADGAEPIANYPFRVAAQ